MENKKDAAGGDDRRARSAAQNPLETAAKPEGKPDAIGWGSPLTIGIVAVVIVLALVMLL